VNPIVFAISHPRFQQAFRKEYSWLFSSSQSDNRDGIGGVGNIDNHSAATTIKSKY